MRILFFNRSDTFKLSGLQTNDHFAIEEVGNFSSAFSRLIFDRNWLGQSEPYSYFLIYVEELNSDLINFLRYIKQNKPSLKLVALVSSKAGMAAMKFHLKNEVSLVNPDEMAGGIFGSLQIHP